MSQREAFTVKKRALLLPLKDAETEVQNQELWNPERRGKGEAGQRSKREGLVLVAPLRRAVTLSWILSGSVEA